MRLVRSGSASTTTVERTLTNFRTVGSAQRAVVERCIQRHRKHVVAVLLDAVDDPPEDESDCVNAILGDILSDNLRAFV